MFILLLCVTAQAAEPIRALLITGGCCHDYFFQADHLTTGINKMANVMWTVVHEGNKSGDYKSKVYDQTDWAKNYDVVVHNECFAHVTDEAWIKKVCDSHKEGVPSVVIHCAMHTYRDIAHDEWRKLLGVSSKRHEHKSSKIVHNTMPTHPIMKDFPKTWNSPIDELYLIEKVWPNTQALAMGVSDKEGTEGEQHVAFWTNQYGKAKVFGTTFGHSNETFQDSVFINTVGRGMLWACDKLDADGNVKKEFLPAPAKKKKAKKKKN